MSTNLKDLKRSIEQLKQIEQTKQRTLNTISQQIKQQKKDINSKITTINKNLQANALEPIPLLAEDAPIVVVNKSTFLINHIQQVDKELQSQQQFIKDHEHLIDLKNCLYELKTLILDALVEFKTNELPHKIKNLPHKYGIKPVEFNKLLGKSVSLDNTRTSNLEQLQILIDNKHDVLDAEIDKNKNRYNDILQLNQFQVQRNELLAAYEELSNYQNQVNAENKKFNSPEVFVALENGMLLLEKINTENNDDTTKKFIHNNISLMKSLLSAPMIEIDKIRDYNNKIESSYHQFVYQSSSEAINSKCLSLLNDIAATAIPGKDDEMVKYVQGNIKLLNSLLRENPINTKAVTALHKDIQTVHSTIAKEVHAVKEAAKMLLGKRSFFSYGVQTKYNSIIDALRKMPIKQRALVMTGPVNEVQLKLAHKRGHWRYKAPVDKEGMILEDKVAESYRNALGVVRRGKGLG